jgi:F-type H+-transporting ATPase subunit a
VKSKKKNKDYLPEDKPTTGNILLLSVEMLRGLLNSTMGEEGDRFLPLIGSIFIYIFVNNLMGLIPGFAPATYNVNTNAAVALVVFFATHYYGFKYRKWGYLKHFVGPVWWLAVLMIPIELVGHLVRPVSLTLRLMGNMLGDHTVLEIFTHLTWLIVPIFFLILGTFVAFVQAFIFTVLSIAYIGGAIEEE